MIVANMATYPPRRDGLLRVAAAVAPQVDRLNVVLNEYSGPVEELASYPNVHQIVPKTDTKDTGKFLPDVSTAEYVFLIDDDLIFPPDFVATSLERFRALGRGRFVAGYHTSLYYRPKLSLRTQAFRRWIQGFDPRMIAEFRQTQKMREDIAQPIVVDQVATNAAVIRAEDMPPFDYMRTSQRFVDVRLASWCFEHSILPIALPRTANWIGTVRYDETIYRGFTKTNPLSVAREIRAYAFNVPGRGQPWSARA
jgi:hypothetical protein